MKYHKSVLGKLIATIIMSFMTYIAEAQSSTNCCSQAQIITYRKAAKLGDAKAMFELGNCYANGTGVTKDEAEAVKWYRKAAELGDAMAKEILAKIHSKEDKGQDFKWRYILSGICGLFGLIELFKKWRSARKK